MTTNPKLQGRRILVVADEETARSVAEVLRPCGCEVDETRTGNAGLERSALTRFDVVLVDLRLPDMRGTDLFIRLRQSQPELPVILMQGFGYDVTPILVPAFRAGLKAILMKPFRVQHLIDTIERMLLPATPGENSSDAKGGT